MYTHAITCIRMHMHTFSYSHNSQLLKVMFLRTQPLKCSTICSVITNIHTPPLHKTHFTRNILEEIRDNKIVRFVWKVWFHVAQVNTLMVIIGNTYFTIHWQLSASGWKLRSLQLLITFLPPYQNHYLCQTPYYHYQMDFLGYWVYLLLITSCSCS